MNNVILNLIEGVLSILFLLGLIFLLIRFIILPILAIILTPILVALNIILSALRFVIIVLMKIGQFFCSVLRGKTQSDMNNEFHEEKDYISWENFKDSIDDSPYSILGVSPDDSLDTIKQVYRNLSKVYHPDRNNSEVAELKMKKINTAWETIQKEKVELD